MLWIILCGVLALVAFDQGLLNMRLGNDYRFELGLGMFFIFICMIKIYEKYSDYIYKLENQKAIQRRNEERRKQLVLARKSNIPIHDPHIPYGANEVINLGGGLSFDSRNPDAIVGGGWHKDFYGNYYCPSTGEEIDYNNGTYNYKESVVEEDNRVDDPGWITFTWDSSSDDDNDDSYNGFNLFS